MRGSSTGSVSPRPPQSVRVAAREERRTFSREKRKWWSSSAVNCSMHVTRCWPSVGFPSTSSAGAAVSA
eukprot:1830236-Prymnesium_polylepis.1